MRPLKRYRPFGPFVASSDDSENPPCSKLMRNQKSLLDDMVEKTRDTGNEHVAMVVEIDGEFFSTDIIEGDEESISQYATSQLNMDVSQIAMDNTPGVKTDPSSYYQHQIHTHPNGYNEQSLTDIKSIAKDLSPKFPLNRITSHLVLVENLDEDMAELFGMYNYKDLTEGEVQDIKSVLNAIESLGKENRIPKTQRKTRMINELNVKGYDECLTTFDT